MLAEVFPTAIPLHGRDHQIKAYALVDTIDWERVTAYAQWHQPRPGQAVACCKRVAGKPVTEQLHRVILGQPKGGRLSVDHINGNKLDNRRCNLRLVTRAQNGQNRASTGSSPYRGVSWRKREQKWQARVRTAGESVFFGLFDTELEAAQAAAEARGLHFTHAVEERHPCR